MHKKIIEDIKARFNHHESKLYLREKYSNQLTIASQGGMWTISPEFIATLKNLDSQTILIDNYGIPIKINVPDLLEVIITQYNEVMNQWLDEYTQLKNKR